MSAAINTVTLRQGDCLDLIRTLADASVDAIVTDPPYELGFMGKSWDASGIAYSVEIWREALRVLKPGGHLLAFSGSRTYHRMTCAIEDAGFEVRDQIMWVYGSGFPKSLNVSKALEDKAVEQLFTGPTTSALDAARQWEGWGTALKPAHEPICVARKPLAGTVAANVLAHGTGALNIDGCRVPTDDNDPNHRPGETEITTGSASMFGNASRRRGSLGDGRWPANLIHDGSPEVVALFPAQAGAAAPVHKRGADKGRNAYGAFAGNIDEDGSTFHADSGSAARFFYCAKTSKADRGEGNTHPTVKPTDLMAYLVRLVTPPGGVVLDPFMGSGSTGKACVLEGFSFIGFDLSPEYVAIASARIEAVHEQARASANALPPQADLFSEG
jgi:site-specific DNA-methyltransferase (adenine-specific)